MLVLASTLSSNQQITHASNTVLLDVHAEGEFDVIHFADKQMYLFPYFFPLQTLLKGGTFSTCIPDVQCHSL